MYVSRVHLHTELQPSPEQAAAPAKQLDADRKQLSQDAATGNMTAEIIDFVDISVDAVAVASTPPPSSSNTLSVADASQDPSETDQNLAAAQSPVTQVPASTVVNGPDPLAAAPAASATSAAASSAATVHPGR